MQIERENSIIRNQKPEKKKTKLSLSARQEKRLSVVMKERWEEGDGDARLEDRAFWR